MKTICRKWKFFHTTYDSDRWLKTHVRFHPVRCCFVADHTERNKYHCSRGGYVWRVTEAERDR